MWIRVILHRVDGVGRRQFDFHTACRPLARRALALVRAKGCVYLAKVDAAGGWKRYAQAHTARLAPIFAKIFPHARLPPELVAHIVDLWAHVGYY